MDPVAHITGSNHSRGQAEKEFKVEVEAVGLRYKNLVGLIGFCADGAKRLLVYEYIDNGNSKQWLHGDVGPISPLTWDIRLKIAIGTANGYEKTVYGNIHNCLLNNMKFSLANDETIYTASSDGTISCTDLETGLSTSLMDLNPNGWQVLPLIVFYNISVRMLNC